MAASIAGPFEKVALCSIGIPAILLAFLLWTVTVILAGVVVMALLASTVGTGAGYCEWALQPSGQHFALHEVSVECPSFMS